MVSLSKSFEDCLEEESQEILAGGTWYYVERDQWGNLRGIQNRRGTGNFWKPRAGKPGASEGHLILQREGAWCAQALDHVATTQTKRRRGHFREHFILWGVRRTLVPLKRANFPSRGRSWKFLFYKEGIVHQLIPIIFLCFFEEPDFPTADFAPENELWFAELLHPSARAVLLPHLSSPSLLTTGLGAPWDRARLMAGVEWDRL